jgi:uncharacterized protein YdgA (DUF945 family)
LAAGNIFRRNINRQRVWRAMVFAVPVVVLLAAVALAALPWWLGTRIEPVFTRDMVTVPANAGLVARDIHYQRGWLSSTASESLALTPLPVSIEASYRIEHGPFLRSGDGHGFASTAAVVHATYSLKAGAGAPPDLAATLANLSPAKMRIRVGMDGTAVGQLAMPPGSLQLATRTISWAALRCELRFRRDGSQVNLAVHLPSLRFAHDDSSLQIRDVALHSDLHRGAMGVLLGYSAVSARSVSIPGSISIEDARAESRTQLRKGLLSLDLETGLSQLELDGGNIGPASLSLNLRSLDPLALRQFLLQVASVARRHLPAEQAQMLLFGRVLQLAGALSRRNPVIEVRQLSVGTRYGDLSGHGNFAVLGASEDISANPMLLLTATAGDAEMTVPKTAFQALIKSRIRRDMNFLLRSGRLSEKEAARLTPETVESITEAAYPAYLRSSGLLRFFRANGDQYLFRMALQRGVLRINGKALNPFARK